MENDSSTQLNTKEEVMADTASGIFGKCDDCKTEDAHYQHWGPLVPSGKKGKFCKECIDKRSDDLSQGKAPRPIGVM